MGLPPAPPRQGEPGSPQTFGRPGSGEGGPVDFAKPAEPAPDRPSGGSDQPASGPTPPAQPGRGEPGPAQPFSQQSEPRPAQPFGQQGEPGPTQPFGHQGEPGPAQPIGHQGEPGSAQSFGHQGEPGPAQPFGQHGGPALPQPSGHQGEPGPAQPFGQQGEPGPAQPFGHQGGPGPAQPFGPSVPSPRPPGEHGPAQPFGPPAPTPFGQPGPAQPAFGGPGPAQPAPGGPVPGQGGPPPGPPGGRQQGRPGEDGPIQGAEGGAPGPPSGYTTPATGPWAPSTSWSPPAPAAPTPGAWYAEPAAPGPGQAPVPPPYNPAGGVAPPPPGYGNPPPAGPPPAPAPAGPPAGPEAAGQPAAPAPAHPPAGPEPAGAPPVPPHRPPAEAPLAAGPPLAPLPPTAPPPQPPARPQNADSLSAETLLRGRQRAPASGWRRALYKATGGVVHPGESPAELRRRELVARACTPVAGGHHRVAVMSLKGGVGKTTTTVGLGATLASVRGDRVIAVDANPDRGTLSDKVPLETAATVRDLLNEKDQIQRYADVRAFTSQSSSRLEVLASDRDPAVSEAFSADDYCAVADVLEHYYSICLTDCGTGLLHSAMSGVLSLANQLVLVSSASVDGARSASATLDWLEAHEHGDLVRNGVVVLSMVRPRSKSSVDLDRLQQHFEGRCRAVVRIPYDPHLEEGAEVELDALTPACQDAYLQLAAEVGDGFAWPQ
ncbi:hypothetical protein DPM19_12715 [Actinomadura craniellae]|uniref:CobQ/CobB/MinD/ParA nucleotide binding domain-containing protein n=2 Tax=Actinomadura craniellae TaxID=2231787 RepID=A0A365H744_9ACTN|nr:hypothetical protein DPM19_12715 [Actinomadura craniellae]